MIIVMNENLISNEIKLDVYFETSKSGVLAWDSACNT